MVRSDPTACRALQAFDHETGRPRRCVEMASWPKVKRFSRLLGGHLRRSLVECFVPTTTGEGISIIFNRYMVHLGSAVPVSHAADRPK